MVVAEVPLWVVHASDSYVRIDPSTGARTESAPGDPQISRAQESLALLSNVGGGAKKCAIYGVDVHPDGTKFATGGGDGTVRIWSSMALFAKSRGTFPAGGSYESSDSSGASDTEVEETKPTEPEQVEPPAQGNLEIHDISQLVRRKADGQVVSTPSKPAETVQAVASPSRAKRDTVASHRLLCTLSAHTGSSVLAVRFSTSGQYLASAGDDAVVCVYAPSTSAVVGGNLSDNVEHWSRIKLCRGHTLDVVGLAWAPDDSHLVSCSLDSDAPIIVWKLTDLGSHERRTQGNVLCNPYKILGKDIHTSTVKGVTFDPAGSYIASSGDDPSVCIWRAHDDWGLEKRIDANSGIFRKWNNVQELSGQTLFRRLSWSTDGAYICSTNSQVNNKHVASTISRDGWSVSTSRTAATGAANLVGHKQPVVVSRHCPNLLDAKKAEENGGDDHDEPDYATLIALGDKRGFVTVWSTRKSRPLFKLQCSESRCTVTDLAWGKVGDNMILLVSMLDGHLVALNFNIPNEIGPLLSDSDQKRVFQLRYGIDFDNNNGYRRGSIFVGDNTTPKLIENALQFTLEDQDNSDDGDSDHEDRDSVDGVPKNNVLSSAMVKATQIETNLKGKKRIRPILMSVENDIKRPRHNGDASGGKKEKKKTDAVQDALDLAAKAASAAEEIVVPSSKSHSRKEADPGTTRENGQAAAATHQQKQNPVFSSQSLAFAKLPHSTDRIHSVELPVSTDSGTEDGDRPKMVADCTNSNRIPQGSSGQPLPSTLVSISQAGQTKWNDEIVGTSCCAMAVSEKVLAVGTTDGSLYLYGTSPSLGWSSGTAFRSNPPLIFGHAIVALQMNATKKEDSECSIEIVVLVADGMFGVYSIFPTLKLKFKGTILPAMTHMILGSNDIPLPKLARIQITEKGHLLMILTLSNNKSSPINPGGSLQAFIYDCPLELWMRISDSRFILSDFYSTLPSTKRQGVLSKMDDAVRSGAAASSIRPSRRVARDASAMYNNTTQDTTITRSHCEDRLACAVALGSATEFQYWLGLYVKTCTASGSEVHLRLLADLLLTMQGESSSSCWWLSSAPTVLHLDRKHLVKTVMIPEMSKNRALQRLTNEIALDVETSS